MKSSFKYMELRIYRVIRNAVFEYFSQKKEMKNDLPNLAKMINTFLL
jgi:L-2-hydroxyglutarate oxidase LhgO